MMDDDGRWNTRLRLAAQELQQRGELPSTIAHRAHADRRTCDRVTEQSLPHLWHAQSSLRSRTWERREVWMGGVDGMGEA